MPPSVPVQITLTDAEPVRAIVEAATKLGTACSVLEYNPCTCGSCARHSRELILTALTEFRAALSHPPESSEGSNGPCENCGRPDNAGIGDTYWFADNELWNAVTPSDRSVLLCPRCFTDLCAEKGIGVGWRAGRVGEIEDHAALSPESSQQAEGGQNDSIIPSSGQQAEQPSENEERLAAALRKAVATIRSLLRAYKHDENRRAFEAQLTEVEGLLPQAEQPKGETEP